MLRLVPLARLRHARRPRTIRRVQQDDKRRSVKVTGGSVALVIDGPDRTEVNDFKGRSKTTRDASGSYTIETQGAPWCGKRNEPAALKTLRQAMAVEHGSSPVVHKGRDQWGEDSIFEFPGGAASRAVRRRPR
jgi:hypothetical protein